MPVLCRTVREVYDFPRGLQQVMVPNQGSQIFVTVSSPALWNGQKHQILPDRLVLV